MQILVTTDDGKKARTEFVFYDRKLLKGQKGQKGDKGDKGDTGAQGSSYTDNILTYSRARKSIKVDADGDTYKHYENSVAHLVQGQQYTVSAQTNAASFSGTHGTITDKCVLWMCSSSNSPQGTVNQVISGNDMTTDGSKGHVFTWNHPTETISSVSTSTRLAHGGWSASRSRPEPTSTRLGLRTTPTRRVWTEP